VPLSEDVIQFVKQHIHSVLQLEVLLLLRTQKGDWTADRVAEELRITEQSAAFHLRDLELRGLVRALRGDSFRYEPPSAGVAGAVDALAEAYDEMKYSVINLIFSVPGDSARSLAEAFRIRKRKDD
jgi:predicted ArsR family transcriptional regulator